MSRPLVFVEKAQPQDSELLIAAMDSTPENLCDPKIFSYPTTTVLKAVNGKPLVFMPIQFAMFLESLAICPNVSVFNTALALSELVKVARWEAHNKGLREMYFLCKEQTTIEIAKRHGFEELLMDKEKGIGLFRLSL